MPLLVRPLRRAVVAVRARELLVVVRLRVGLVPAQPLGQDSRELVYRLLMLMVRLLFMVVLPVEVAQILEWARRAAVLYMVLLEVGVVVQ